MTKTSTSVSLTHYALYLVSCCGLAAIASASRSASTCAASSAAASASGARATRASSASTRGEHATVYRPGEPRDAVAIRRDVSHSNGSSVCK